MKDCSSTRSTWALHGGRKVILLWEAQCKQSSVCGAKTKFSRQGRVGAMMQAHEMQAHKTCACP